MEDRQLCSRFWLANRNRLLQRAAESSLVSESRGEKPLRTILFVIHATRGLIRDPNARRKTMFIVVLIALVLLFSGSTCLESALNPHEHPIWFILFWLICAWLALTALLLAVFDMLMVRAAARKAERILRSQLPQTETPDSPRSTIDE
jgi:hypothetical protein